MLPAAIQDFGIDAASYLAGLDEMITATDRLAESIDSALDGIAAAFREASAAADEAGESFGAALDAAAATADDAAVRSDDAMASMGGAMDAAAAKITDGAEAVNGVMADLATVIEDAAARIGISAADLADGFDRAMEASDRAAGQIGLAADAAERSVGAYEAAAAAADEFAAALDRAAGAADVEGTSATRAGEASAGAGAIMKTALLGVAVAVGVGVEQAGKFQATMLTLSTQAGVSKSQIAGLSQGVLGLAGQVGFSPESLAEALYHVESSFASVGIKGPKALSLLQTAAEGAAVGHANLTDVTNALDATIVAGVPGITSYAGAMGALNAVVGSGDMSMQDLANAMGTGVMAVAKSYGQSIYQVGAALALFGDNNIRGAKAATELRMAWQAMQAPLTTAGPALSSIGLTMTQLGHTMSHQGMSVAIEQFVAHLKAAKVPMSDWGQLETEIFGKRAGVGIGIMVDQLGRLNSKFPDLKKGSKDFGAAWQATQQTLDQQWKETLAAGDALIISFGSVLLPVVTRILHALAQVGVFLEKNPAIAAFAGAILAVAVAFKVAAEAEKLFAIATSPDNAPMLIIIGVILLAAALYELYKHFKSVRDVVADVGHFLEAAWGDAVKAAGAVTRWFVTGPLAFVKGEIAAFKGWWADNSREIRQVWDAVWHAISTVARVEWAAVKAEFTVGVAVVKAVWKAGWDFVRDEFETAWHVISDAIRFELSDIGTVISIFLDVLTGHWGKAWDTLKGLPGKILGQVGKIVGDYVGGIAKTARDLGKNLLSGISGIWDSITGSAVSGAKGAGKGAASAFAAGWDDVYRDTVGEVVRAFEAVKGAIVKGFDGWWKSHGKEIKEVWHAVWSVISTIFTAEWDSFMAVARPAFDAIALILTVAWDYIASVAKTAWDYVAAVVKTAWDVIAAVVKIAVDMVAAIVKTAWDVLMAVVKIDWAAITMVVKVAWDVITGIFDVALDLVTGHWSQAWKDVQAVGVQVWNAIKGFLQTTLNAIWGLVRQVWNNIRGFFEQTLNAIWALIRQAFNNVKGFLVQTWNSIYNSVVSAWGTVNRFFRGVPGKILAALGDVGTLLYNAGKMIIQGLINGIKDMGGKALSAVGNVASSVYHHALSVFHIGSPSKLFYYIGSMITQGLAAGIAETTSAAVAKATALAAAVNQAYKSGQITAAEQTQLLGEITSAIDARKDKLVTAMKKLGLEMGAGMLASLENATSASTAKTAVDKLISYVQQAWSAGDISASKASSMTAWLEADNTRLQSLAAQRQTIEATIKTATTFANTTTASTESWAGLSNVTSSMTSGGMVYSGNILAGMKADLSSINQFTAAIRKLGKMGLRKDLLNQLIQMGPAQGLQVAQALLDGPAKVIAQMDATQAGIASGSTALGQAAANAMYDTGQSAGKGFLSGLQAQESQVTKMMDRVAKSMAATLKKELGEGGSLGKTGGGNITVTVHGFIGSEQQLVDELYKAVQQESLRHAKRNGTNGLSL